MIATIKVAVAMLGTAFLAILLGSEADTLNQDTPVSLGAAVACAAAIVSGVWWLSRWKTRQDTMHAENQRLIRKALRRTRRQERNMEKIMHKLGLTPEPVEADLDETSVED
jgi:uncharacterized membrane protein YccC